MNSSGLCSRAIRSNHLHNHSLTIYNQWLSYKILETFISQYTTMANGIHNITIMETTTSSPPKRANFTHIRQGTHELMIAISFMVRSFGIMNNVVQNHTHTRAFPLAKKRCVRSHTCWCHKTHIRNTHSQELFWPGLYDEARHLAPFINLTQGHVCSVTFCI